MSTTTARSVRRRRPAAPAGAFSLIEVVLAIGIVVFAMIPLLAMLPVGLKSVSNANEQAAAANILARISNALRNASSTDGIAYTGMFAGTEFRYVVGGNAVNFDWPDLNMDAYRAGEEAKRLSARLEILQTPSADPATPGRALISVAWPAVANPQWNPGTRQWSKAEGSLTTAIQFSPKP